MSYNVELEAKHYDSHRSNTYSGILLTLKLDIVAWMRDNDIGPFTLYGIDTGIHTPFVGFEREEDAIAFKLVWL